MTLTYKGKTQNSVEWSKEVGLTPATIISRKARGWSDEKTLSEPIFTSANKITKNDGELYLNDLERHQLPEELRVLIDGRKTKKFGQLLRAEFSKSFDKWYNETYKPEKENENKHRNLS